MTKRILIIEDNPANLELMSYLLNAHGYQTIAAVDGEMGLKAAEEESPDLIVCDVEMPRVDGLDVASRLKSSTLRSIPLVAVTAYAMVGDRDKILAAGFDGYIAKPITPEKFVGQVEAFFSSPERSVAKVSSESPVTIEKAQSTRGTVLVVDNSFVNILLMRSILEPSGYTVMSALNVDDGLVRARATKPDLIISDVHMSSKDGFVLLQTMKSDAELQSIPFIFLSSTGGGDEDARRSAQLGADRFIKRPIDPGPLLAQIKTCIASQAGSQGTGGK